MTQVSIINSGERSATGTIPTRALAASGDNLRLKIMWGKPVVGAVFQFSAFLEY